MAVRLINLDGQNNYVPDYAKSWTISPDGLTYTFNLRTDAMCEYVASGPRYAMMSGFSRNNALDITSR